MFADLPKQFGPFNVIRKLGEGGMGIVFEATDTRLARPVAIKIPKLAVGAEAKIIARFYREARVAGAIEHANICPVFEVDEVDGIPYLTMPLLKGEPLSAQPDPGELLPLDVALEIVQTIANAMAVMHQRGFVHRDLKPSNIFLKNGHEPVVMDFGLARSGNSTDRLTTTGAPLGTPAYMSPEHINSDPTVVGPHSDVYSLGVIHTS